MTLSRLASWLQNNRLFLDLGKNEVKPDGLLAKYNAHFVEKGIDNKEKYIFL